MRKLVRMLAVALALCVMGTAAFAEADRTKPYALSSTVGDFTVTDHTGRSIGLSEMLKDKDMVLLHFWDGSSAGMLEMAIIEMAASGYEDEVAVLALCTDAQKSDAELAAVASSLGLHYALASDLAGLAASFLGSAVPVSVVIDRNAQVGFLSVSAIGSADAYARLFDAFAGEDYQDGRTLTGIPGIKPNIPLAAVDRLAEALNAAGGDMRFTNPADVYVWPMIPAEEDGRLCLMSTNAGVDMSVAAVYTTVEAKAGDVLSFTFKTSTETACDLLVLRVNGEAVKAFGGVKDWMTYAWSFAEDGVYEIALSYEKDMLGAEGRDVVYIDDVALLGGSAAEQALGANPAYPAADVTELMVEGARQIIFDDPTYALISLFGLADYCIVPAEDVQVQVTLAAEVDPERAYIVNYYSGEEMGLVQSMTATGYAFTTRLDSMETTGFPYTNLSLYPAANCGIMDVRTVVCFVGEENANAFVEQMTGYGYGIQGWSYPDGQEAETTGLPGEGQDSEVCYVVTVIDQQGEAVPGVTISITDGSMCELMTSDGDGVIEYTAAAASYQVHVVKAPEGCTFEAERVWTFEPDGGEVIIDVTREINEEE
ncbi:MAG: peroxiredoxin family protein [Aristaeellaceae bacterium]